MGVRQDFLDYLAVVQVPKQWADVFADHQTLTAAMLDRLLHHAHIVQIMGESSPLKDRREAGQTSRRAALT